MIKLKGFCLFTAFLMLILSSCFTGFFPATEENVEGISVVKDREYNTKVKFNNSVTSNNVHKIRVFSDRNREVSPFGPIIPAQSISDVSECIPNSSYSFYVIYYLNFNNVEIPYKPAQEKGGFIAWPIHRDKTTEVPISPLSNFVTDPDEMLVTDAYYFTIKNSGLVVFSLASGGGSSIIIRTENGEADVLPNQTGIYRLTNTSLSNLKIVYNVISEAPFPISSAARGKVYSFNFTGSSITSLGETNITLRNSMY